MFLREQCWRTTIATAMNKGPYMTTVALDGTSSNEAAASNAGVSVNAYVSNTVTSSSSEPFRREQRKGGGDDETDEDGDDGDGGPPDGLGGRPNFSLGMFKIPTRSVIRGFVKRGPDPPTRWKSYVMDRRARITRSSTFQSVAPAYIIRTRRSPPSSSLS